MTEDKIVLYFYYNGYSSQIFSCTLDRATLLPEHPDYAYKIETDHTASEISITFADGKFVSAAIPENAGIENLIVGASNVGFNSKTAFGWETFRINGAVWGREGGGRYDPETGIRFYYCIPENYIPLDELQTVTVQMKK